MSDRELLVDALNKALEDGGHPFRVDSKEDIHRSHAGYWQRAAGACRWWADARCNGAVESLLSWDTMRDCVRRGITLTLSSVDWTVYANERSAPGGDKQVTTTDHKTHVLYVTPSDLVALYGDERASDMQPYRQGSCDSCGWMGPIRRFDPADESDVIQSIENAGDDARGHREQPEVGSMPTVPWADVSNTP